MNEWSIDNNWVISFSLMLTLSTLYSFFALSFSFSHDMYFFSQGAGVVSNATPVRSFLPTWWSPLSEQLILEVIQSQCESQRLTKLQGELNGSDLKHYFYIRVTRQLLQNCTCLFVFKPRFQWEWRHAHYNCGITISVSIRTNTRGWIFGDVNRDPLSHWQTNSHMFIQKEIFWLICCC